MKNKHLFFGWAFFFIYSPFFMRAQSLSAKAFFNSDTIPAIYLGIDFTLGKADQ